jgi:hypothetical protein
MAETQHKKQIAAALTALRIRVQNEVSILGRKLDLKHHFLEAIKDHPWEWASCAAIFGWLLSRIPPVKRESILTASVKNRSNVLTRSHSASFGEKFGNSPNR